jgi:hypothetical protein
VRLSTLNYLGRDEKKNTHLIAFALGFCSFFFSSGMLFKASMGTGQIYSDD